MTTWTCCCAATSLDEPVRWHSAGAAHAALVLPTSAFETVLLG